MGKRSYNRRPFHAGKYYPSCVWALISLFNIHQGQPTPSPKLLSDRQHGNGNSRQDGYNSYSRTEVDSKNSFQNAKKLDDLDENTSQKVSLGMSTSVKTLIDEEMSQEPYWNHITTESSGQMVPDTEFKFRRNKNHKLTSKKLKGNSDVRTKDLLAPVSLDDHRSNHTITAEKSPSNFDLAALLLQYYGQGHQWQQLFVDGNINSKADVYTSLITIYRKMHEHLDVPKSLLDKKWPMLVKALADLSQEITSQNVSDEKLLNALRAIGPTEFLNALDTDQIKEALLKLLHDPLSHKLIPNVSNSQVQKSAKSETGGYSEKVQLLTEEECNPNQSRDFDRGETQRRRGYSFFSKKEKWNASKPSKTNLNSLASNEIVVLEPSLRNIQKSPTTGSPRSPPQLHMKLKHKDDGQTVFSYKDIKQRIKSIFGGSRKEQRVISMNDGVLHTLAIECHDLVDRNKQTAREMNLVTTFNDEAVTSSETVGMCDIIGSEKCQIIIERDVACPLTADIMSEKIKRHLVEMQDTGSNDEQISPKCIGSFHKEGDTNPSTYDANRLSSSRKYLTVSSLTGNSSSYEVDILDPENELLASHETEEPCSIGDYSNEGIAKSKAAMDKQLETSLAQQGNELNVMNELYTEVMQHDKSGTITLPGLAPSPVIVEGGLTPEKTIEKPGKGSPVSVLDKLDFSVDIMSPEHTATNNSIIQQLNFEEHIIFPDDDAPTSIEVDENASSFCIKQARLIYIETVLEASGLIKDDLDYWNIEDQFIDPSLFDELGPSCYLPDDDRKVLFDYINEVLGDLQEKFSRYSSYVYSKKLCAQSQQAGINLLHEVNKIVDWTFSSELPETMEQMIEMDFYCKTWMDLEPEIEEIVTEVWDVMFDDLMKESSLDLWFAVADIQ